MFGLQPENYWCVQSMICRSLDFGIGGLSKVYNAPLSNEARCSVIREALSNVITLF